VVPSAFTAFFAASAGVAGALIGLLFVAVSVAPAASGAEERLELDVRAGVAFSALTDTLVVSLFALIPGVNLGVPTLVTAIACFASCVALGIVLWRTRIIKNRGRKLSALVIQSLVFVFQFTVALPLINNAHDEGAVRTIAVLTVVFFLVGIARAWQLIGARDRGLVGILREAIHEHTAPAGVEDGHPEQRGGQ